MEEIKEIINLSEKEYIKKIEKTRCEIGFTAEDKNLKKIVDIFETLKNKFYDLKNGYREGNIDFYFNRMKLLNKEIMKVDRPIAEIERIRTEFAEIYSDYLDNKLIRKFDEHDKKILEMMGIFLSIFSVIGLGVSSVLNLENNHIATWLMMCGTILITMSGLFNLINPDKFNKQEKKAENNKCKIEKFLKGVFDILRKPIIIGVILLLLGGIIRCKFPNDNEEIVKKEKFEQVEKRVQNNENELLDKNLDYRNQIKDLKEEIKKLQSKVEKLKKKK